MPQTFEGEIGAPTMVEAILKRHTFLRRELARAADLTGRVIIEQKPPLCRTLLPLYRLFQELRQDLEEYLDIQETRLLPRILEVETGVQTAGRPVSTTDELVETLRILRHGQATLTSVLDEMQELTQGFLAPVNAQRLRMLRDFARSSRGHSLGVVAAIPPGRRSAFAWHDGIDPAEMSRDRYSNKPPINGRDNEAL